MLFPEARATQDMDFFLSLSLFIQTERGTAVRTLLDHLGYEEHIPKFQFAKPFDTAQPEIKVKVDFLARSPEDGVIAVKPPRVGHGSGINLHGRETPEGFAVDDHFQQLLVQGVRSDGVEVKTTVRVAHPYAWLNLKVKAAHDWLRMERGEEKRKPNSEKHVFDVYTLVAMLTETELSEAVGFASKYNDNLIAEEVRRCAKELYETNSSPGVDEIRRQAAHQIDYPLFWETLSIALAIQH